jgi:uncharacterized membrane protein
MKKIMEYPAVFIIGGLGYGLLELLYRGRTHWTMLLAGGLSLLLIYASSNKIKAKRWQKWVMGAFIISTIEFVTGGIVNILLGLNVWSYSHHRFSLMGQICLLFSFLWFLLCIPAVWLCELVRKKVFKTNK